MVATCTPENRIRPVGHWSGRGHTVSVKVFLKYRSEKCMKIYVFTNFNSERKINIHILQWTKLNEKHTHRTARSLKNLTLYCSNNYWWIFDKLLKCELFNLANVIFVFWKNYNDFLSFFFPETTMLIIIGSSRDRMVKWRHWNEQCLCFPVNSDEAKVIQKDCSFIIYWF